MNAPSGQVALIGVTARSGSLDGVLYPVRSRLAAALWIVKPEWAGRTLWCALTEAGFR